MDSIDLIEQLRIASKSKITQSNVNWGKIPTSMWHWIAGHADGDGYVSVDYKHGLRVGVKKAKKGYNSINLLKELLGGNIYDCTPETEKHQESKTWVITGLSALEVCKHLQFHSKIKQEQFTVASEYPLEDLQAMQFKPVKGTDISNKKIVYYPTITAARNETGANVGNVLNGKWSHSKGYKWEYIDNPIKSEKVREKWTFIYKKLKVLKKTEHLLIEIPLTLPYVAGFIDADGCFTIEKINKFKHTLAQKYIAICNAFQKHFGGSVCKGKSVCYKWSISKNANEWLKLIAPYLVEKKKQADLILNLNEKNYEETRKKLSNMKGHRKNFDELCKKFDNLESFVIDGNIFTNDVKELDAKKIIPKYITELRSKDKKVLGYRVRIKKHSISKCFTKKICLEQDLEEAIAYLNKIKETKEL